MNKIKFFDRIQEEEIVKLYSEGKSLTNISVIYNTCGYIIKRILLKNNISMRNKIMFLRSGKIKFLPEEEKEIIRLYKEERKNTKQIGIIYKCSRTKIQNILKEYKVLRRCGECFIGIPKTEEEKLKNSEGLLKFYKNKKEQYGYYFSQETLQKQSISKRLSLEKYPDTQPHRILAKNGKVSVGQRKLYDIVKQIYPDAELEYPIKSKLLDVGVPSLKLDFEFDGWYYHKDTIIKDLKRDEELESLGWKVIRFTDKEIEVGKSGKFLSCELVKKRILKYINEI